MLNGSPDYYNVSKHIFLCILAGLLLLFYIAAANHQLRPDSAMAGIFDKGTPDHLIWKYTTIMDEQGNTLSMMARVASVGDELYPAEGRSYRVEKVQGDRAEARFLGMDPQIVAYNDFFSRQEVPVMKNLAEQKKGIIGICIISLFRIFFIRNLVLKPKSSHPMSFYCLARIGYRCTCLSDTPRVTLAWLTTLAARETGEKFGVPKFSHSTISRKHFH